MNTAMAERRYVLRAKDGSTSNVTLTFGVPQSNDGNGWSCAFEILRDETSETRFAAVGEDGVQALLLAFPMAEAALNALARKRNETITLWDEADSNLYLRT